MSLQVATQYHSYEEFREATLYQLDYITNVQSIHFDNIVSRIHGYKTVQIFWLGIFAMNNHTSSK